MPRSYRHIKEYELELNELRKQGLTENEIGKELGFSYKQVHNFLQTKSHPTQTCGRNCIKT